MIEQTLHRFSYTKVQIQINADHYRLPKSRLPFLPRLNVQRYERAFVTGAFVNFRVNYYLKNSKNYAGAAWNCSVGNFIQVLIDPH